MYLQNSRSRCLDLFVGFSNRNSFRPFVRIRIGQSFSKLQPKKKRVAMPQWEQTIAKPHPSDSFQSSHAHRSERRQNDVAELVPVRAWCKKKKEKEWNNWRGGKTRSVQRTAEKKYSPGIPSHKSKPRRLGFSGMLSLLRAWRTDKSAAQFLSSLSERLPTGARGRVDISTQNPPFAPNVSLIFDVVRCCLLLLFFSSLFGEIQARRRR